MTSDPEDTVERDDLAPIQRLHLLAEMLAESVQRQRADARRSGNTPQHPQTSPEALELLEQVCLDRPRLLPLCKPESSHAR